MEGVWLMLNQETPKEYILSNGSTHSVRTFIEKAFSAAGIGGFWEGSGVNEEYHLANYIHEEVPSLNGLLISINPKFYRPAEVEILHGDSSPARNELGWKPKISFDELVLRMVTNDIQELS